MKKPIFLLAIPILLLLSCCGSPGREPHIEINSIGLQKIPLKESGITSYTPFPGVFLMGVDYDHWVKYSDDVRKEMRKIFHGESAMWYYEVCFMGKEYYLVNYRSATFFTPEDVTVEVVGKQDRHTVLKLQPFPVASFVAHEVVMNDKPYLVVYVDAPGRYGRRNESALYIADADLKVVYKEILTRAVEIGWTSDKQYGSCIVLRSINGLWDPEKEEWHPINGEWVYYLP